MKNLSMTLIALFFVLTSCAKTPEIGYKKFYRNYRDTPNTVSFRIPAEFAGLFIDSEDKEVKDFFKRMDDISFFIAENATKQMILDLNSNLPEDLYKEMMVIQDGGSEIVFLARENGKRIEEIVMTVVGTEELVVLCIFGDFTYEDAKKIAKSIKTDKAIKIRN